MVYICPIGSREGMNNLFFWKSVFVKHPNIHRPWLMEQVLATISAGHQKAAWGVAGVDTGTQVKNSWSLTSLTSLWPEKGYEADLKDPLRPLLSALVDSIQIFQEGYEAALKGPPRPAELSSALVYSIKLSSWQPPHFGLTVQCVAPILPKVISSNMSL